MIRSWRVTTLTGSAQPAFGDVTTAAVALPLGNGIIPVTVADTTKYQVGDRIYLDPLQANQDMLMIDRLFSATVLWCRVEGETLTHTHANGAIIQLSIPCAGMNVQPLSANANALYVGPDNTILVTPAGNVSRQILPGNPPNGQFTIGYNIERTSDVWMVGTSGDKVIVAAEVA